MLGSMPVRRQVEVGSRAREREPLLGWRHLLGTPVARTSAALRAEATDHALGLTGLIDRSTSSPDELDTAEQRLVQIARVLATGARALLVDEPAAGMSQPQRNRLASTLRHIAAEGHGVLLVEHDMQLVGRVADRVTVLAEGRVLATGNVSEVRADPAVARAYLGVPSST